MFVLKKNKKQTLRYGESIFVQSDDKNIDGYKSLEIEQKK